MRSRLALIGASPARDPLHGLHGPALDRLWGEKVQTIATDNGTSLWGLDPGCAVRTRIEVDESPASPPSSALAQGDTRSLIGTERVTVANRRTRSRSRTGGTGASDVDRPAVDEDVWYS